VSISKGKSPVALIFALEVEAREILRRLTPSTISTPGLSVWEGVLEATPVVLVITGVGKVAASLASQFICDVFMPSCFVTVGLAGATGDEQPGGLTVASGAAQHDMDARPLTDARGTIPSLGITVIPADPVWSEKLRRAAASVVDDPQSVKSGVVLTGDQIVASRELRDRILSDFPDGACLDMETAAVAQVARQNDVPWAGLRMTSDAADESFNLDEVIGFGVNTAAALFDRIVRSLLSLEVSQKGDVLGRDE
jgi:adenosylhomocysteine nucleosidase